MRFRTARRKAARPRFNNVTVHGYFRAYDKAMDLNLTAVFKKVPEGYIGFVEELPGANTQGATLEEARANLQEAVALVLEANRDLIGETTYGSEVIREPMKVGA
jgi:predicted RNase H-like HicB family nuclease